MYFSVPIETNKRKLWIEAIEKHQSFDYYASKFYVCELHFPEESLRRGGFRTDLKPNVVPTIFCPRFYEFIYKCKSNLFLNTFGHIFLISNSDIGDLNDSIEYLEEDQTFFEQNPQFLTSTTEFQGIVNDEINNATTSIVAVSVQRDITTNSSFEMNQIQSVSK